MNVRKRRPGELINQLTVTKIVIHESMEQFISGRIDEGTVGIVDGLMGLGQDNTSLIALSASSWHV